MNIAGIHLNGKIYIKLSLISNGSYLNRYNTIISMSIANVVWTEYSGSFVLHSLSFRLHISPGRHTIVKALIILCRITVVDSRITISRILQFIRRTIVVQRADYARTIIAQVMNYNIHDVVAAATAL